MSYIPDDISQIPDNHPDFLPAPQDRKERLTIFLHKQLDQVIDQEHQPGHNKHKQEQLKALHQQIRQDLTAIRYSAREADIIQLERKYHTHNS